ncbi:XrtA system polysaccharide chain length determinant [Roseomonas xinghualingensis]|uniref:XrtA system polysaccharide chain length determinant n=1 Tax=Roseomonas xinghualingensis TaxID=2986475 RepID=UPI0021F206A3|nr:XrtA system polysaccharide chain length determinant [Roseomonas sp. SXEYE001]MCV4208313.1 hypothetical protein [Roseomonas sp. SXEYE001]
MQIVALVRRHAAAAWRFRWKALAVAWLVCLLGWVGVHAIPDRYQVRARVYADADAVLGVLLRGIALDSSPAGQVELLQRTLLSRPNLEMVFNKSNLSDRMIGEATRESLLEKLSKDIRITAQTRNLFTIEYSDPSPQMAYDVVKNTLDVFVEAAVGSDREQFENARQFLLQQIAFYEARLREAEQRRADFQAQYIDLLPSEGGVSRLEGGRSRVQQLRGELQDARMRRDLTKQQLVGVPPSTTEGGNDSPATRLVEAERNLRELRLRFTNRHPDVVTARALLQELRANGGNDGQSTSRASSRPNPVYEQIKMRLVDAEAQVASLERQVRDGEAELDRLDTIARGVPEVQAQFMNLDRDYTVLRRNLEELLARRESIQIADAARVGTERVKLEVVDPPMLPTIPVWPKRGLLDLAVLVLGLGAGGAVAILLGRIDGTFYTVHDLRALGLPVLGGISAVRTRANKTWSALAFGAACTLLLLAFGVTLLGPALLAKAAT